jgi:hypothetical protein
MIVILSIIFISVSIVHPKSTSTRIEMSLSETRIIDPFSSTWYEKISGGVVSLDDITSNSSIKTGDFSDDVTLMRFKFVPLLTASDSWILKEPSIPLLGFDHYYWSWYLYAGSGMTISWNYNREISVYVVRSVYGYEQYYDDTDLFPSYVVRERHSSAATMSFNTTLDDIYFVIFENWATPSATGGGTFNIYSKLLNVSGAEDQCSFPCSLMVPLSSDHTYVLHTPTVSSYASRGKGSPNSVFTFDLRKGSRTWLVAVVLYVIPLVVIAIIFACLTLWLRRRTIASSKSTDAINMQDMASVDPNAPQPGGATVMVAYPPPGVYPSPTPYPPTAYPAPSYPQGPSYPPPDPSSGPLYPHYDPSAVYPPQPYPSQNPSVPYNSAYPQADGYTPGGPPPSTSYPPPATSYPPPPSSTYPPADAYAPTPTYTAAPLPPLSSPPPAQHSAPHSPPLGHPPPPTSSPYEYQNPNYPPPPPY